MALFKDDKDDDNKNSMSDFLFSKSPIPNPQSPIPNPQSPFKKNKCIIIYNE